MSNINNRNTALYARLSKEDGESGRKSNSISSQMNIMREFAEKNGFGMVVEYADDGFTGTNLNRPDFQIMMKDIERGLVGTVIVKDLSRLSRDHIESGILIERTFPKYNVRFISIMDGVDSIYPNTLDKIGRINVSNEEYARGVSLKMRFTVENKGKSGRRLTTRAIYGYVKDPEDKEKWLIDETAAEIVRKIFSMYNEGKALSEIAFTLAQMKIVKPSIYQSKELLDYDNEEIYKWSLQTITDILGKQDYCGDIVNFRTTRKSFKDKKVIHNGSDKILIFENSHPAIIDRDTFEKAQKRLALRKRVTKIDEAPLFTNLVYCADCKCRMHIMRSRSKGAHPDAYVCATYRKNSKNCDSHYIRVEQLCKSVLNYVSETINEYKSDPAAFRKKVEERLVEEEKIYRDSLQIMIEETEAKIEMQMMYLQRSYENLVDGLLDGAMLLEIRRRYSDSNADLKKKLLELNRKKAEQSETLELVDIFFRELNQLTDAELTPENILPLIDRIEVNKGKNVDGSKLKYNKVDVYFIGVGMITD